MEIICENLAMGYGKNVLHRDINFTIPSGSYTCIVGDNGTGKSTLIKTLLGLIPAIQGSIALGDTGDKALGYLPQQSPVQKDFPASVFEIVISGCLNRMSWLPFYRKAEKQRAHAMMVRLGIADLAKQSYSELSGGQQQRVLLARALCATDKALLLDEPGTGLDEETRKDFYALLRQLNKQGTSIIMITHHLKEVINDADYVLCLRNCGVHCMTKDAYDHHEFDA
ncbi:MAG: ABC transporter ATP-binding protein [Akkermansia sp.]